MKLEEINIRDPYVLAFEGTYYLYGTRGYNCWEQPKDLTTLGFDVYTSQDLINWQAPQEIFRYEAGFWGQQNFWAPEVHVYQGKFYLFATFTGPNVKRGTQVLKSDSPLGPFIPYSKGALTPKDWECLDGTLFVDERGAPHLIFCHEWVQIRDGTICSVALSDDLSAPIGEVRELFKASEPTWSDKEAKCYVTDGPFLHRCSNGKLLLFWSSLKNNAYVQAIAYPDNDCLNGNWQHSKALFFDKNGGHGMLFQAFDGQCYFTLHQPNEREHEHPVFLKITEEDILSYLG
ncbi:glycoside hydrolase family 43 protein [Pseudolactococcus yaeyamensis]